MITFYGRKSSDNVQKTLWMLLETGQPFKHIELGGQFGGLEDPSFLKLNPHGRVPVLQDGDTVIWESNAIVRYLAARYCAGTIWPEDPAQRAIADQWMDWGQNRLYQDFNRLFWLTIRTPAGDQDAAKIARTLERLNGYYQLLEAQLDNQSYIAGTQLTIADIQIGSTFYRYFEMDIERPELPIIANLYARLQERAAFLQAVMVPFEELRGRLAY